MKKFSEYQMNEDKASGSYFLSASEKVENAAMDLQKIPGPRAIKIAEHLHLIAKNLRYMSGL